jgi:hypothetical protein
VWHRRREATSARLSAAPYSAYSGLYSEAVVSSAASAVALTETGRFKEALEHVQKAAKTLYEAAKEVFEHVKVAAQRLVELFVEAVTRVLAWINEHKAYLFLKAAVAAGVVALSAALNMWGLIELEKLAYATSLTPFFVGLADVGERAAERFRALRERYERGRVDESLIDGVLGAPLRGERPYVALLKLAGSANLPKPLAELRRALTRVEGGAEKDAAVVTALVLYKTLVKNAGAYGEWAGWYKWARSLVKEREFTVKAEEVKRLREAQKRLENAAEEVRRELNNVLALYASHSRDIYEKLRPHLEVDLGKAEGLAEARSGELSNYSDAGLGTRVYAALLSVARGGAYGHAAMLLAGEGALADIVLLTPEGAYEKAKRIAKGRGEVVDPSYSGRRERSVGQPSWEDRAASVLLRYLLGSAVNEDLKFRRVEGGFEVFRTYGGVETRIDELKIGKAAHSKAGEEELRRFVEVAKEAAPDLSGIRKIWQTLEWLNTDVSFLRKQIVAGTAHPWQLRWYIALLGKGKIGGSGANVTEEGVKPNVAMYWPREALDRIIAAEREELEPLLGRAVKSWRELVDAVDWSWVLERVGELAGALKSWIGPERMSDAERERLVKRMLGELALLAHFAETRRGMDDGRWRGERAVRLAKAVEALSGGRIAGEYAERLAELIISYAESRAEKVKKRIDNLAGELAGVSKEEVWGVVEFVLSDMHCLARDCARDEVFRKFVAPALELIMLDKALRGEFDREEALLRFGEMYATAVAGDGHVGHRLVVLAVGGELGGGAALLRLATLLLLNQLLSDKLKFDVRAYVERGRYYNITAYGGDAARFKRLLAVSAPSAGGGYLSPKFEDFVKEARVEVRPGNIRLTKKGRVATDLTISEAGIAVKYNVYLRDEIELKSISTDRSCAELAARLLKLAGVSAEVRKEGGRDVWYVYAYTDKLVAGREELRKAIVEIVETALARGWVDEKKAGRWLDKLERRRMLRGGWPKYLVKLKDGALMVRFGSTNPDSIEREAQRLKEMGLVEGKHFSVKMPEGGRDGYVSILKEGLGHAAWLSVHGSDKQRRLAAEFVEYILQRAEEKDDDVYEKAKEIVEAGRSRGSLTLRDFVRMVEVGDREHVVKVIGGDAELEESRRGKKLLRIRITAEVDRVAREYAITYGRYGRNNAAVSYATARADAPGGRETDAERLSALIKALTGREPRIRRRKDGTIEILCDREHLDGFRRFAELADAIEKWLEETGRRA